MTVSVYAASGGFVEDVLIPINETFGYNFDILKKRPKKHIEIDPSHTPNYVDTFLFTVVESNPKVPALVMYEIHPDMLMNIVKTYKSSVFTQHEALASLHRVLQRIGERDLPILDFLNSLMNDQNAFFSLRCHAIYILSDIIHCNNISINEKAEMFIKKYFLQNIVNPNSVRLQSIESIHPCIIISIFEAISRLGYVNNQLTSMDYLFNAILQVSGSYIEPYLFQLTSIVSATSNKKKWQELVNFLFERLKGSDDPLTQSIALHSIERLNQLNKDKARIRDFVINDLHPYLFNHDFHLMTRLAIARLIIKWVPNQASIAILRAVCEELELPVPNYHFIDKALQHLVYGLRNWGQEVRKTIQQNININTIYDDIRFIMSKVVNSHNIISSSCKELFQNLNTTNFKDWIIIKIPDGIIKSTPLSLDHDFDEGMFSDDDD